MNARKPITRDRGTEPLRATLGKYGGRDSRAVHKLFFFHTATQFPFCRAADRRTLISPEIYASPGRFELSCATRNNGGDACTRTATSVTRFPVLSPETKTSTILMSPRARFTRTGSPLPLFFSPCISSSPSGSITFSRGREFPRWERPSSARWILIIALLTKISNVARLGPLKISFFFFEKNCSRRSIPRWLLEYWSICYFLSNDYQSIDRSIN